MDLDRIKRNVAKMAAQSAPESDIDGYIASEGATIEQIRAHKPQAQQGNELAWSDVPGQAAKNFIPSASRFAGNIAQTVLHLIETAKNLGNLAYGVGSKIGGALGVEQDPQRKAENEAGADAVGAFFKDRYGSIDGLKRTLAEDPVGAAADAATVLTGGGAALARAPGMAGKVGQVVKSVGSAVDPIANVGRVAAGTGKVAGALLGMTSGVGEMPIRYAYKAGKEGNKAFVDNMRGVAPITDTLDMAKDAVGAIRKDRSDAYLAGMKNVKGQGLINFDPVKYAVNDAYDMTHFKGVPKSQAAADVVNNIAEVVSKWEQIPSSSYRTAEGLDALKQAVGEIRQKTQYGSLERKVADQVYNRIKDQVVKQVPEYATTMKGYSQASDQIDDITKTFSLGEKASTDTALRKLTSVMRNNVNTNFGQRAKLMDVMAQKQPDLPFAIAGQAVNSPTPRGLQGVAASGAGIAGLAGNPTALAMLPFASPRLVGEAARAVGMTEKALRKVAKTAGVEPSTVAKALLGAYATGTVTEPLRGGIGPRYDENANPRSN